MATQRAAPAEISAEQITFGLERISTALRSRAWLEAERLGLTPTQGQILAHLLRYDAEPQRLSDLSDSLGVKPATVSDVVTTLVRKSLVDKVRASDDGRALALTLTPAGRQIAQNLGEWSRFVRGAVAHLKPAQKEALLDALSHMLAELAQGGEVSEMRMCASCSHLTQRTARDRSSIPYCRAKEMDVSGLNTRLDCNTYSQHKIRSDTPARDVANG